MEETILNIFNGSDLTATRVIDGQVKEIMELSEIKLECYQERNSDGFKAMGTRVIQPGKSHMHLIGTARVDYISKECNNILDQNCGDLFFEIAKNHRVLYCYAKNVTIGEDIYFTAEEH